MHVDVDVDVEVEVEVEVEVDERDPWYPLRWMLWASTIEEWRAA